MEATLIPTLAADIIDDCGETEKAWGRLVSLNPNYPSVELFGKKPLRIKLKQLASLRLFSFFSLLASTLASLEYVPYLRISISVSQQ
jgi:hypothetical protein